MAQAPGGATSGGDDLAARILELAIRQAEEVGWHDVRLQPIAAELRVSLAGVRAVYADLDAVANAWFGRALDAMLAPVPEGFGDWPARERLFLVMMRFFDALAAHREVTVQMLQAKAWPSHPHHWLPMIFDLSRLVHWILDAGRIEGTGPLRGLEEIGGTALVLATLADWARDRTPGFERTRARLRRRLALADRLLARALRARRAAPAS